MTWGPCADTIGSYVEPLAFGVLTSDLTSSGVSIATDFELKRIAAIVERHCPGDEEECKEFDRMMEELYPIHADIVERLLEQGLI